MQVILGAGGSIGVELAQILPKYTDTIRLFGRNPSKVNDNDELFKGDLTDERDVKRAVEGADVAYLTVGLPYRKKVWSALWPMVMENTIKACQKNNVKLVFFDNIYMYDRDHLELMTEETPIRPTSVKGQVRTDIHQMFMRAVERGWIEGLVARSADFYGPSIKQNGVVNELVFNPLAQGKKASWLCSLKYKHSATYTPDAAAGTAILGNSKDAYNQVWHLPTADNPLTGAEWIEKVAAALGVKPKSQVANRLIIALMGLSNPTLGEVREMMYQYDRDYVFDSSKFNKKFDYTPVSYDEGIQHIVKTDFNK